MAGSSQIRLTVGAEPWTLLISYGAASNVTFYAGCNGHWERKDTYTLKTPGGMPAFWHSSAMIMVAPGSRSDGLTIKVLPALISYRAVPYRPDRCRGRPDLPVTVASAALQSTIIAGKLNGVMAAVTPRGSRREYVSMSAATSSLSPRRVDVMAVAVSTTCRPRPTSPSASAYVLPCSSTIDLAMSPACSRIRCCSLEDQHHVRSFRGLHVGEGCERKHREEGSLKHDALSPHDGQLGPRLVRIARGVDRRCKLGLCRLGHVVDNHLGCLYTGQLAIVSCDLGHYICYATEMMQRALGRGMVSPKGCCSMKDIPGP